MGWRAHVCICGLASPAASQKHDMGWTAHLCMCGLESPVCSRLRGWKAQLHLWTAWNECEVLARGAMSKGAGRHGKDSGGIPQNHWRENLRHLWFAYEEEPRTPWAAWLQELAASWNAFGQRCESVSRVGQPGSSLESFATCVGWEARLKPVGWKALGLCRRTN